MGHEDEFPPPRLNGGCRLGKATFAGMGGKEEDAPIRAVRGGTIEPPESTLSRPSLERARTARSFSAVSSSIATRSPSLKLGVARMWSTAVLVQGNG